MSTTDTQNGRHKGHAVPALPTHTFQDSGITVKLHKLSPMTSQDIIAAVRRELADTRPEPPLFEVDYGKGKIQEPNESHPIYQRLLKEWEATVSKLANERLFKLAALDAVEVTIDDAVREQIRRKKRLMKIAARLDWQDDPDLEPDENDQLFYITHIACASPEDVQEFYQAIALRSQPTEAAIEQHKASFRGDIQAAVGVELPPAERDTT